SFFFFQAEDGIRDFHVTGVQTCALPIWCLMPGGDHLVTVYKTRSGWVAEADPDAVFDVGYAQERYTVPGEYGTPEDAMRAAERELYALLCRITSGAGRR